MPRRRAAWLTSLAVLVGASALAGCGGDDSEPRRAERAPAIAEHVGKTDDAEVFVALALDPEGRAEAYACDGRGHAAAFQGTVRGDRLDLTARDGAARLTANVRPEAVAGSLEFRGERKAFKLSRARGVGGLYTFRYSKPEAFAARSERGNEIDGRQTTDRLSAVVTTTQGDSRPLDARLGRGPASQRGYREYRVILLDDGDFRGNRLSGSALLTSPTAVRNRPIISPA